jgi:DNA-binding SARP family transcriptional activator
VLRLITLGRLRLLRDGLPSESIHLQPKRLALLAFLALAAQDGVQQRDTLLALFWPHSDRERARRCLRQALFHLRNELGDGVIVNAGREGLRVSPYGLWCDAVAVDDALRRRHGREALETYGGDFLPGLFVDDCSVELEEWAAQTRLRLRSGVVAGAWDLVEQELREGRAAAALESARRARALAPDDEDGVRRHMTLLARVGQPAAAVNAYAEFARRQQQHYDAEPSAETRMLAETLRHGEWTAETVAAATPHPAGTTPGMSPWAICRAKGRRRTDGPSWGRTAALLTAVLVAGVAIGQPPRRNLTAPVGGHLLLTQFTNHTRDSLLAATVTEALRAELSRTMDVRLAGGPAHPVLPDPARDRTIGIVMGDVTAAGPGFTVSASLLSPTNGQLLARLREEAPDSRRLLPTVERLSRRLRGGVMASVAP